MNVNQMLFLKKINKKVIFEVIFLFVILQFLFKLDNPESLSELIGYTLGQLILSIIIVFLFKVIRKFKRSKPKNSKSINFVKSTDKSINNTTDSKNNLTILVIILLMLQPFALIHNQAQENNATNHKLQFDAKNWNSNTTELPNSKNFKFQQTLIEKTNPDEKIQINYVDKSIYQNDQLKFYKLIQEKKLLVERKKNLIYSNEGSNNDKVTFYLGADSFLKCIDTKYKKLNNNWYSIQYKNNVYFVKSKDIITNYRTSEPKNYEYGFFGTLTVKDQYPICIPEASYFAYRDDNIRKNYFDDFFESQYFATGFLGEDYALIKANLTNEYDKSYDNGSTDNNYDRLINGLSTTDYEKSIELRSPVIIQQDLYSQNPIILEFYKTCNSNLYLKKSTIPPPIVTYQQGTKMEVMGVTKHSKVQYKIWYDTCLMYGVKKETKYTEGYLNNTDNSIQIFKNNYNIFNEDNIDNKTTDTNPLTYQFDNKVTGGDKLYSKNKITGTIDLDLEQIGKQNASFEVFSDKSQIITYNDNSLLGSINSLSKGLVRGIGSIFVGIGDSIQYYTKPDQMTTGKTISNSLGLISAATGTLAAGLALTGIGLPLAGVLGVVSAVTGTTGLATGLALNNEGQIETNLNKLPNTISNNFKSTACTEYGSQYEATTNKTEITDWAYCIGNIGSIATIAMGGAKVSNSITSKNQVRTNKAISKTYSNLDNYQDQINTGILPDQSGKYRPKDNIPQLVNPNAIKPKQIALQEDISLIKTSINSGVTKLEDIGALSVDTKKYLQQFIDAGDNIFDCIPTVSNRPDSGPNTDSENTSYSLSGKHLASLHNVGLYYHNTKVTKDYNNNLIAYVCNATRKIEYLTQHRESLLNELNNNLTQFKSPILESAYDRYQANKNQINKQPRAKLEWLEESRYWSDGSPMARGNRFNKLAEKLEWYKYNEVYLENGKFLDGYTPPGINKVTKKTEKGMITSRKCSDLGVIGEEGLLKHIKELKTKYAQGTKIKSKKVEYRDIYDTVLDGDYYIELPESNLQLPDIKIYEKLATDNKVTLIYKPEK